MPNIINLLGSNQRATLIEFAEVKVIFRLNFHQKMLVLPEPDNHQTSIHFQT